MSLPAFYPKLFYQVMSTGQTIVVNIYRKVINDFDIVRVYLTWPVVQNNLLEEVCGRKTHFYIFSLVFQYYLAGGFTVADWACCRLMEEYLQETHTEHSKTSQKG